jgi:uncharacterized protein YdeI (YjbR/CyaY-like superfamily)
MGRRDPRVDAYIAEAAAFARPILTELRETIHAACPDVEEDMKWRFPHFLYKGMLCSMAAFKQHAAFGFWKGALVIDDPKKREAAMGHLGRITSLADLPAKRTLAGYVKKAAALNDRGVTEPRVPKRAPAKPLRVPADLRAALKQDGKAQKAFDNFRPSHRREYVEWITGAKSDDTRARRLKTAIAWIGEGKSQNWRYEKKRG